MNPVIETILKRRSTRVFQTDQIFESALQSLLEAGQHAPSGMNRQPWHFSVVQRPETLNRINEACRKVLLASGVQAMVDRAGSPNFSIFYKAPTLILVTVDEKVHTGLMDGAAALENMFLASEALGLGSCWIHAVSSIFDGGANPELRQELGIPEGYIVVGSGAFGYKASSGQTTSPRRENTITIVK